jgi:hypothetical protein
MQQMSAGCQLDSKVLAQLNRPKRVGLDESQQENESQHDKLDSPLDCCEGMNREIFLIVTRKRKGGRKWMLLGDMTLK